MCRADQLVEGRGRSVRAGGHYVALFLVHGEVFAVENECLHVCSPLDGGPVVDGLVICPWHGWAYDLATGDHMTAFGPRPGIRRFEARIDEGRVKVTVDDPVRN